MKSRSLRILLCCQQDSGTLHPVPAYRFWAEYFRAALAEAGHSCLEIPACDWAAGLLNRPVREQSAWREETWSRALQWLKLEHSRCPIDLVIGYLFPTQVEPAAIATMRELGIPCVNFFCDNVRLFRRAPEEFRSFDLHWVPEYAAQILYRNASLPFIFAPMPCWVAPRWRTPPEVESLPPTFVGTRDSVREHLFAEAFSHGLLAELRGYGWAARSFAEPPGAPPNRSGRVVVNQIALVREHGVAALARKFLQKISPPTACTFDFQPYVRPMPAGDDYARVLRETTICLGVNRYPSLRHSVSRPATYSRLRDLEAPMCGACYLTEWAPGLDELYEPGREIETYRTGGELAEKSRSLAANPTHRSALRRAGQRRALTEHTIQHTITRIADRLGLGKK